MRCLSGLGSTGHDRAPSLGERRGRLRPWLGSAACAHRGPTGESRLPARPRRVAVLAGRPAPCPSPQGPGRRRPPPATPRSGRSRRTTPAPQVVVSMDTANPSAVGSLIAPLRHVRDLPVAVVAPFPLDDVVAGLGLDVTPFSPGRVDGLVEGARCLVTAGQYLPVGVATERAAQRYGRPVLMVQHGALTPYAPPLPPDSTVLAWSEADGEFWRSGRDDVRIETVGSQLLWDAGLVTGAGAPSSTNGGDVPLTYLGQGHAAELPQAPPGAGRARPLPHSGCDLSPAPIGARQGLAPHARGLPPGGHRRRRVRAAQPAHGSRRERLLHRRPRGGRAGPRGLGRLPGRAGVVVRVLGALRHESLRGRADAGAHPPGGRARRRIAEMLHERAGR